jgi:hypothetical protein
MSILPLMMINFSKSRIKFNNKKTADIVKNSLDVDKEYSENVRRTIEVKIIDNGDVYLIL